MDHGRLSSHNPYVGFFKHAPKSNEPFADRVLEGEFESPSERITLRKLKHSPYAGTFHLAAGVFKSTHNRFRHNRNDESELRARLNELPDFSILASLVHERRSSHYTGRGHMHSLAAGHSHHGLGTGRVVIGRPAEDVPCPSSGVCSAVGGPLHSLPGSSCLGGAPPPAPTDSHASLSSLLLLGGQGSTSHGGSSAHGSAGAGHAGAYLSSPPSSVHPNRGRLPSVPHYSAHTQHNGSSGTPQRSRSFAGEVELGASEGGSPLDSRSRASSTVGGEGRGAGTYSSPGPSSSATPRRGMQETPPGGGRGGSTRGMRPPSTGTEAGQPWPSPYARPVAIGRGAAPEGAPLPLLVPHSCPPPGTGTAAPTAAGGGAMSVQEEEEDIWQLRPFVEGAWSTVRAARVLPFLALGGSAGGGEVCAAAAGAGVAGGHAALPQSPAPSHPVSSSVVTIGRSARTQGGATGTTSASASGAAGPALMPMPMPMPMVPTLAGPATHSQSHTQQAGVASARKGSAAESTASSSVGSSGGGGVLVGTAGAAESSSGVLPTLPSIYSASTVTSLQAQAHAGDPPTASALSSSRHSTPLLMGGAGGMGGARGRADSGRSLNELMEDEGMPLFAAMHMLAAAGAAQHADGGGVGAALPPITIPPDNTAPYTAGGGEGQHENMHGQEHGRGEDQEEEEQEEGSEMVEGGGAGDGSRGMLSPLSAAVAEQWRTLWLARLQAEREGHVGIGLADEGAGAGGGGEEEKGAVPLAAAGEGEAPYEYVGPSHPPSSSSTPFMLAHIGSSALLSSLGGEGGIGIGAGAGSMAGGSSQLGLPPSASLLSFRPDQWEAPASPVSLHVVEGGSSTHTAGAEGGGPGSEPTFTIGSPAVAGSATPVALGFPVSVPPAATLPTRSPPSASPAPLNPYILPLSCGVRREDVRLDYDLGDKPIGAGGYAEVRKAVRRGAGGGGEQQVEIVIKCIKKRYLCTEEERDSAQREVDIQNAVTAASAGGAPPHIVPLLGCYEDGEARNKGFIYLVLEASPGGDLRSYVRSSSVQRFSEFQARIIAEQLLEALDYLHSTLGIVHLDVKPDNVLVHGKVQLADTESSSSVSGAGGSKAGTSTEGKPLKTLIDSVRLCDFGNARRSRDPRYYRVTGSVGLVPFTQVTGTFGYVAPEILARHHYGSAADMFSLGVLLYELLAGYAPWYPASDCLTTPLAFPDQPWAGVSTEAKDLVGALLAMDPKRRMTAHAARAHAWLAMSK